MKEQVHVLKVATALPKLMQTKQPDLVRIVLVLVWSVIQSHSVVAVYLATFTMEIPVIAYHHVLLDGWKLWMNVKNVHLLVKIVKTLQPHVSTVKLGFIWVLAHAYLHVLLAHFKILWIWFVFRVNHHVRHVKMRQILAFLVNLQLTCMLASA